MFLPKQNQSVEDNHKEFFDATSFRECIVIAKQRNHMSDNRLAALARVEQSRLNKYCHNKILFLRLSEYLRLCMALKLTKEEAVWAISWDEKAFKPCENDICLALLEMYSTSEVQYSSFKKNPEHFLDKAEKIVADCHQEYLLW